MRFSLAHKYPLKLLSDHSGCTRQFPLIQRHSHALAADGYLDNPLEHDEASTGAATKTSLYPRDELKQLDEQNTKYRIRDKGNVRTRQGSQLCAYCYPPCSSPSASSGHSH